MSIRDQIFEHIAEVMRCAEDRGADALAAAKAAFPGTPESVLGEALWMVEERRAGAWWCAVEKTIDGEIIKAALMQSGGTK